MKSEWYESFFTSLALDFWRAAVPPEATVAEVDFLIRELGVVSPSRLLDLPSGCGRHAIALATRRYEVTGIDISAEAIVAAESEAKAQGVKVTFIQGDMRRVPAGGPFDGAYCFGNSFGYLSHDDMRRFVRNVLQVVRPGARWAIDTGAVAESVLAQLVSERTLEAGGVTYTVRNRYDAAAQRLLQTCTLVRGEERQTGEISQAVYTLRELHHLLEGEGWQIVGSYGALDSRPFEAGDRLRLLARRP